MATGPRDDETPVTATRAWGGADIGIHLLVCVLVGGGLGFALDRWLGWAPWLMLAGGFLGFAAWFRGVMTRA